MEMAMAVADDVTTMKKSKRDKVKYVKVNIG
jgi:hypothetical protein